MGGWRIRLLVGLAALATVAAWLSLMMLGQPGGPLAAASDRAATFATVFLGIFIEAAPFLLLGTLASGLVEVFVSHDQIQRFVPRDPIQGAIAGAMLGLFFPVCECGVVPLTRRLLHKGLPLPVGVTFLLAAPVFNPIVIASTLAAFGLGNVFWLRMGLTLLIAMATGLAFAAVRHPERLLQPAAWAPMGGGSGRPTMTGESVAPAARVAAALPATRQGLPRALNIAVDEFFEMGRYLVLGALLAALLQTVVPRSALLGLGTGPIISVVTLIALAVVLSICSTVDAFIALSFAGSFTTGSVIAFLVFGPMVDVKSTLMFLGIFRRRAVGYLVLLPLALTVMLAVAINLNTSW